MNVNASRKRRRPALACEECRRRKIKCDRKTPCDHCSKFKSLTCTYYPNPKPTVKSRSHGDGGHQDIISTTEPELTASSATSSTINQKALAGAVNLPSAAPSAELTIHLQVADSPTRQLPLIRGHFGERVDASVVALASVPGLQALTARVQTLEQRFSSIANKDVAGPGKEAPSVTEGSFSKTRYFGRSHWMNNIETVRAFILHVQYLFYREAAARLALEDASISSGFFLSLPPADRRALHRFPNVPLIVLRAIADQ